MKMKSRFVLGMLSAAMALSTVLCVTAAETAEGNVQCIAQKDAGIQTWQGEKFRNYGSSESIKLMSVSGSLAGINSGFDWNYNTGNSTDWKFGFIEFDISGLSDKRATEAKLVLGVKSGSAHLYALGASDTAYIKDNSNNPASAVDSGIAWTEGTGASGGETVYDGTDWNSEGGICWIAQPLVYGKTGDPFNGVPASEAFGGADAVAGSDVEIDITQYIHQKIISGAETATVCILADGNAEIYTRESSNKPKLEISYRDKYALEFNSFNADGDKAVYSVEKNAEGTLYTALYDESGLLKGVKLNETEGEFDIADGEKYTFRAYLWDANQCPVVDSIESSIERSIWEIKSPSGNNSITVMQNWDDTLIYTVENEGRTAVDSSPLGLVADLGDFTTDLTFVGLEEEVIDETYELLSGKRLQERNYCNETTLKFVKDEIPFNIVFRAYDDGIALRYEILGDDSQEITFRSENTAYNVPSDSVTFAQAFNNDYERTYDKGTIEELNGNFCKSLLYHTPDDVWVMVAEADPTTQYCGMMLSASSGSTMLREVYVPTQGGTGPKTTLPFESPWRALFVGTQKDIAESQLLENLSDPCQLEDTSWIEPGITTWTWLNGAGVSYDAFKTYVDLTAEMGWKYMLMDEGWDDDRRDLVVIPDWMDELVSYADSKGVKLLAWLHIYSIDTYEEADDVLSRLAEAGIVGAKMDFFSSESQKQMAIYDYLNRLTAKYHLIANYHGCNLPSGERRTWPHVLSRESVRGDENGGANANQTTIMHLTRNATGPMDFTPVYSWGSVTRAHRLAMTVAFECGIPCLAGSASEYRNSAAYNFFRNLPAVWDETLCLESEAAEYVTMARKSKDTWYVGGMTTAARTASVDLSFLDDNEEYYAYIYTDGNSAIVAEERMVTSNDVLNFDLKENGGFAIKLSKEKEPGDKFGLTYTELVKGAGKYVGNVVPENNIWEFDEEARYVEVADDTQYQGSVARVFGTYNWTWGDGKAFSGSPFYNTFDGDTTTYFDGYQNGYAGVEFDEPYCITKIKFNQRSDQSRRVLGGELQASEDGENYVTLYRFDEYTGVNGDNYYSINIENIAGYVGSNLTNKYKYFRFINMSDAANPADIKIYSSPDDEVEKIKDQLIKNDEANPEEEL